MVRFVDDETNQAEIVGCETPLECCRNLFLTLPTCRQPPNKFGMIDKGL